MSNDKVTRAATENHIAFLAELYHSGVDLRQEDLELLRKHKVDVDDKLAPIPPLSPQTNTTRIKDQTFKHPDEIEADQDVVVSVGDEGDDDEIVAEKEYSKRVSDENVIYEGRKVIRRADWMPNSVDEHTKEFVEWIDSINFQGFSKKRNYKPFNLYRQQARDWLAENSSETDFNDENDRDEYRYMEVDRCAENSLYFLDKYIKIKEGDMDTGHMDYSAKPVHEVIAFLFDCGYSCAIGKPRQIAATTTLGALGLHEVLFKKNFFLKFVTQDKEKGIEIFRDKIVSPFGELPWWMKPEVSNDRDNLFALGRKEKKGDQDGVGSKIQVAAPTPTVISGGAPQLSFIDEAGNINILSRILENANPTMYRQDPVTKKIRLTRRLWFWGTGGDMEKGGKAFEREFMGLIEQWKKRQFGSGIIPLFFDWSTRPGIDQAFYDQKKIEFYSKTGPDAEKSKVEFHQQYPTVIEDMFLMSSKTLVDMIYINTALDRCLNVEAKTKPKFGYFEPIYDTSQPMPENVDVPFKIIGATFVPVEDTNMDAATVVIFHDPKPGWKNRYYQGTDPIASNAGLSNMSSSIWDAYYNTISAVVNYRSQDYKYTYLQCVLLGIFYDTEHSRGVKELVEGNIGSGYIDYKEIRGDFDSLVQNTELPEYLQGGSNLIGVDNRVGRARMIINKLSEMIHAFGLKIFITKFWLQLKTFVSSVTDKGNETWGPIDKRHYQDDILFSSTFAYICALCYSHLTPTFSDPTKPKYIKKSILVRGSDGHLRRVEQMVKV